uniref:Uncharacterized protein n=1 Tax=Schistocephalus solidus TaxID=70667 RepID=A0A0X3PCR3_SCHSO
MYQGDVRGRRRFLWMLQLGLSAMGDKMVCRIGGSVFLGAGTKTWLCTGADLSLMPEDFVQPALFFWRTPKRNFISCFRTSSPEGKSREVRERAQAGYLRWRLRRNCFACWGLK